MFLSISLPLSRNLTPSLIYHNIVRKRIVKVTGFLSFCPFRINIFPFLTIGISMYQHFYIPFYYSLYFLTPSWFPFGAFQTDRQNSSPLVVTISLVDISVRWLQYLVSKMEFTVLNSPKGFWRSLPKRSHSFLNSFLDPNLKTRLPTHWYPFPLHSQGLMPCKQQSDILTVYQTQFFAYFHTLENLKGVVVVVVVVVFVVVVVVRPSVPIEFPRSSLVLHRSIFLMWYNRVLCNLHHRPLSVVCTYWVPTYVLIVHTQDN
jgi:hypothetical protein